MTLKQRISALVERAIEVAGSGAALAARLGVSAAAVTNWKNGHDAPNAHHLITMQDLVKKAACVLIALGTLLQPGESGATGLRSAHGQDNGNNLQPTHCATFARLWKSILSWLLTSKFPEGAVSLRLPG